MWPVGLSVWQVSSSIIKLLTLNDDLQSLKLLKIGITWHWVSAYFMTKSRDKHFTINGGY